LLKSGSVLGVKEFARKKCPRDKVPRGKFILETGNEYTLHFHFVPDSPLPEPKLEVEPQKTEHLHCKQKAFNV
jgi:hypothetical protein